MYGQITRSGPKSVIRDIAGLSTRYVIFITYSNRERANPKNHSLVF